MADMVPNYDELDDDDLLEDEESEDDFEFVTEPLFTFAINPDDTVGGFVDDIEAIKQAVMLILNIERYDYTICGWDYGSELKQLIGMPIDYCIPEIERLIAEALLADARIVDVTDFRFESEKRSITVTFTVHTEYGETEIEQEINV